MFIWIKISLMKFIQEPFYVCEIFSLKWSRSIWKIDIWKELIVAVTTRIKAINLPEFLFLPFSSESQNETSQNCHRFVISCIWSITQNMNAVSSTNSIQFTFISTNTFPQNNTELHCNAYMYSFFFLPISENEQPI